ncbi:unnamed protein product [Prorocentrum cordatum]|uniref:Uncharacterized protein n=1 Tax=Prorocentrum cordatum TaxID=2364126 RepID=A0ABN9TXW7_9DINO|nr:unnamed protein product [Polarella glacialis]
MWLLRASTPRPAAARGDTRRWAAVHGPAARRAAAGASAPRPRLARCSRWWPPRAGWRSAWHSQQRGGCCQAVGPPCGRAARARRSLPGLRAGLTRRPASWRFRACPARGSWPADLMWADPAMVDDAIDHELGLLEEERVATCAGQGGSRMRKGIAKVRGSAASEAMSELMYLRVCSRFRRLGARLVSPMREGGHAAPNEVALPVLSTNIHSQDALALLYQTLSRKMVMGPGEPYDFQRSPRSAMPVVCVGQLYVLAMMFGHLLRNVDARFQLEKSLGAAAGRSLQRYLEGFAPRQLEDMARFASLEAQLAAELHVRGLFGDLRAKKEELLGMLAQEADGSKRDTERRVKRVLQGSVLRFQAGELRRVLLEAVAFGGFLGDVNCQVSDFCAPTPSASWRLESFGLEDPGGSGGSKFLKWLLE